MHENKENIEVISLVMLIAAVVYVFCCIPAPKSDPQRLYALPKIGIDVGRTVAYIVVMVGLFAFSFFVKDKK